MDSSIELYIFRKDGTEGYQPPVEEDIEWSTERKGVPGKLTFTIVGGGTAIFTEGDRVRLTVNGGNVFYGFIFTQKRDKAQNITITAYDQLRYLKGKDTYVYEDKTASQFLQMVAADFPGYLQLGTVEETGFIIETRTEENTTLFDMINNALELTTQNTRQLYVLYDDFGKLTLKNISNMRLEGAGGYFMIDEETGENFDYGSSIDSDTYNKIKLTYDNEETGTREVYIAQDTGNMNQWGPLQYFETLQKGENGQAKADALLALYNHKTRSLNISKAIGDIRVRAGSMIIVKLNLGDMSIQNFMLVEKAKHTFGESKHFMDLTLRGGEFNG
jgi:hypothetical protein